MKALKVKGLFFSYDGKTDVLKDINFEVKEGELIGIIGPNGSGKTTFFKIIAGFLKDYKGYVELFGTNLKKLKSTDRAKKVTVISQSFNPIFDFKVIEILRMGRIPYHGFLRSATKGDEEIIEKALKIFELEDLKDRYFHNLSEGEKRRVIMAKAYVQDTKMILVDELTAHLDIDHTYKMAKLMKRLVYEDKKTLLVAFHNLNIAGLLCDKILMMKNGEIVIHGKTTDVYKDDKLRRVYDVDVRIIEHPECGKPQILIKWDGMSTTP